MGFVVQALHVHALCGELETVQCGREFPYPLLVLRSGLFMGLQSETNMTPLRKDFVLVAVVQGGLGQPGAGSTPQRGLDQVFLEVLQGGTRGF